MPLKKKAQPKAVKKMLKKLKPSSDLERLAQLKMPNWRVVEEIEQDSPRAPDVDAVSPKLRALRSKVKVGKINRRTERNNNERDGTSDSGSRSNRKGVSGLVNMAPESGRDADVGVKTQVFEDDEHTASQG